MALPTLTPEQRADALAKAAAVRAARAAVKTELKAGTTTLAAVLGRTDNAVAKMKVSALLQALPKVGKVKAAEIMTELEIAENRRVAGLGDRQRAGLLERFAS